LSEVYLLRHVATSFFSLLWRRRAALCLRRHEEHARARVTNGEASTHRSRQAGTASAGRDILLPSLAVIVRRR
jgi:hypothetical protein